MDINHRTDWHSLSIEETFRILDARETGLTQTEVNERVRQFGRNEILRRASVSPLRLFAKQFANFFVLVLVFAAALAYSVSFMPGESGRRLTAFFILGVIGVSVALSFFEELRAQRELEGLDELLVFKTIVIRDGEQQQIEAGEVVPGDILVLSRGMKVPADARLIKANSLRVDESALTGESMGVDKSPEPTPETAPLSERTDMAFGSTFVTQGSGLAVAVHTGMRTEVGKIADTLQGMAERPTPFQVEVQKMARQMTVIVGSLAVVIALILVFVLHEPLVDVALNTLSLAVATIPESLPIVLTLALALGARQMAARHAVVRRLAVVESLGSVDTICTDKTGTLTQNSMAVEKIIVGSRLIQDFSRDSNDNPSEEIRASILCNEAVVQKNGKVQIIGDPVDTALLAAAQSEGLDIDSIRNEFPKVQLIPFSSERKMMTTIHGHNGSLVGYTKGAPGPVLKRCSSVWVNGQVIPLDTARRGSIEHVTQELQSQGMYLLGFARKDGRASEPVADFEQDLTFLGLQALMDPPRPNAAEAIARVQGAGVRVVMITGDNALTGVAVARQLGIGQRVAEARELDGLPFPDLRTRVKNLDIIARATPETKQRVLNALQDEGHFVAMTGDGVNDATALKQADVGVAMGQRGTDIAKESAAMVLLDDNFATIVAAVEEGRRIFDNIRKFTNYLLSTSLGEVFIVLALSAMGYFPLSAKMLLWVNVATDLVPASALAADPAVPHVMKRRPRRHTEPILNRAMYATIAGSIVRTILAYGLLFWLGLKLGGVDYARTVLFTSIVLHAFTRVMVVRQLDNLSLWSNRTLLLSYVMAVGLQLIALYTPLRQVFGIVALDWRAWAVMIPTVIGSSLFGVYMTRWILKYVPLWEK
jgi:P-type Ca2+ transporter type 2C